MSEKTEDTPPSNTDDTEEEVIKEEVELHFYIYHFISLYLLYILDITWNSLFLLSSANISAKCFRNT